MNEYFYIVVLEALLTKGSEYFFHNCYIHIVLTL